MAEDAPADQGNETPPAGSETPPEGGNEQGAEDVEALRKALAKANGEAKDYRLKFRQTEQELTKVRQSTLSDAEKAVAEAEARGRSAAVGEFGTRLARTEFDAIAGRRNPEFKTAEVMDFINLSKFVGDDGTPDSAAIKAAVERLVPEANPGTPGFDGGSRTPAAAKGDMNGLIRGMAGLG